jgi:hypothetical protein
MYMHMSLLDLSDTRSTTGQVPCNPLSGSALDPNDIDDHRDDKAIDDLSHRFTVCRRLFPPGDLPNRPARLQFHYSTRNFHSLFFFRFPQLAL